MALLSSFYPHPLLFSHALCTPTLLVPPHRLPLLLHRVPLPSIRRGHPPLACDAHGRLGLPAAARRAAAPRTAIGRAESAWAGGQVRVVGTGHREPPPLGRPDPELGRVVINNRNLSLTEMAAKYALWAPVIASHLLWGDRILSWDVW